MAKKLGITPLRREIITRSLSAVANKQLDELERQYDEMLEALIDDNLFTEKDGYGINYHRNIEIIEKATGRTWAEVKEAMDDN